MVPAVRLPLRCAGFTAFAQRCRCRQLLCSWRVLAVIGSCPSLSLWVRTVSCGASIAPENDLLYPVCLPFFSYGYLTWEWQQGLRGYLHPLVFATLYKSLQIFGLDTGQTLVSPNQHLHLSCQTQSVLPLGKYQHHGLLSPKSHPEILYLRGDQADTATQFLRTEWFYMQIRIHKCGVITADYRVKR